MYNAYVPLMLADHLDGSVAVGGVLSTLNLIAPLIIPLFAALSDRTVTRIGRRMPYIVGFLPPAALALALVPVAAQIGLYRLLGALVALHFFRHAARGPVVALMPDLVPPDQRSQANGVINTMGGLAAITATVLLAPLITVAIDIPGVGPTRRVLPFWITSVLMVASTVVLFLNVREPVAGVENRPRESPRILTSLATVFRAGRSGALPILAGVLLSFTGWKLISPFVTLYARDYLGAGEAAAGLSFGMIAISQTAFAIPGGIIAARFGRRRVISVALLVLAAVGLGLVLNHRLATSPATASPATAGPVATTGPVATGLYPFWALLFLMGLAWVILITNSLPMLWDIGGPGTVGLYTGLYYLASQTALVAGPGLGGIVIEYVGFGGLFLAFSLAMVGTVFLLRMTTAVRL
jgi:maltose/moltooligosaccharide transporter